MLSLESFRLKLKISFSPLNSTYFMHLIIIIVFDISYQDFTYKFHDQLGNN